MFSLDILKRLEEVGFLGGIGISLLISLKCKDLPGPSGTVITGSLRMNGEKKGEAFKNPIGIICFGNVYLK